MPKMESQKILFCVSLCVILGELSEFALSLPAGLVFRDEEISSRSLITFVENTDAESGTTRPASCSYQGRQFRLHQKSGKCFQIYTRGPCGENMMFFPAPIKGNVNGVCQCKRLDDENPLPLVHDSATDRCYPLYKQGSCKSDEWLVYSETGIPKCQVNPCKDSKIENVVLFEGECVELFESHPKCTTLFPIIGFGPENFEPLCTFELADKVLLPKGNSTCKNGFKFVGSRCRKVSSS